MRHTGTAAAATAEAAAATGGKRTSRPHLRQLANERCMLFYGGRCGRIQLQACRAGVTSAGRQAVSGKHTARRLPARSRHARCGPPARQPGSGARSPARDARRTPRRMRAGSAANDSLGGQMVRRRRASQSSSPPTLSNSRRLRGKPGERGREAGALGLRQPARAALPTPARWVPPAQISLPCFGNASSTQVKRAARPEGVIEQAIDCEVPPRCVGRSRLRPGGPLPRPLLSPLLEEGGGRWAACMGPCASRYAPHAGWCVAL